MTADVFLVSINCFVAETAKTHKAMPDEFKPLFPSSKPNNGKAGGEVVGVCPRCGGSIADFPKGFFCSN